MRDEIVDGSLQIVDLHRLHYPPDGLGQRHVQPLGHGADEPLVVRPDSSAAGVIAGGLGGLDNRETLVELFDAKSVDDDP